MRYLFTIFNRLNSGGVRLNNQEIRNCIYSGQFNDMLKSVDRTHRIWQTVHRRIWGKMDRFRSVEILLRMLAFSKRLEKYNGNLAGFLNDYMLIASKSSSSEIEQLQTSLEKATSLAAKVVDSLGVGKRSLTFMEGILVGVSANLETAPAPASAEAAAWAKERAEKFKTLSTYSAGARYALASAQTVKERLRQAIATFA